jgi:predicted double-glycine peptidase
MMRGLTLVTLIALAGCAAGPKDHARFIVGANAISDYVVAVQSVEEMRFTGIVRQRFDFSCGSAALATLMRYHYGYNVREDNAFRGMWNRGDQAQIRRLGFSLLDMKSWLGSRGLRADGYKVSLDDIAKTGLPGIALISVRGYRHFVVIKGVRGSEVLIGDPSTGLTVMPRKDFLAVWNGIYFIINDEQPLGKDQFNKASAWGAFARAPIHAPFSDPVSLQALSITAPFYGDIS